MWNINCKKCSLPWKPFYNTHNCDFAFSIQFADFDFGAMRITMNDDYINSYLWYLRSHFEWFQIQSLNKECYSALLMTFYDISVALLSIYFHNIFSYKLYLKHAYQYGGLLHNAVLMKMLRNQRHYTHGAVFSR